MAKKAENGLANPYQDLVNEMKLHDSEAEYMASFVDASIVVQAMKDINYNVQAKIALLGKVIEEGSKATIPQKIAAMKELDDTLRGCLAARGILVEGTAHTPGSNVPLGLAKAPIESVEMTERSVKMTMAATEQIDKLQEPSIQPLVQETDDDNKEDDTIGQAKFFEDDRTTNPQIFRPADTVATRASRTSIGGIGN